MILEMHLFEERNEMAFNFPQFISLWKNIIYY